jgi:lysophospholipid acyltransferase (LPLAT)-like uncharacterized protein
MRTLFNTGFPRKQIHVIWGWMVGMLWFATALLYRLTLRVERHGTAHLHGNKNYIMAFWHENLPIYFHVELKARGPQVWMQHPALFMTSVHAMIRLMGVRKLAFGSTGSGGRQALEEVIALLRQGYSTVITPDGPRGPVKELKPGALIMAAETGLPIIPVTFRADRFWTLPTWDRKKWPKPFSRVDMILHPPIFVSDAADIGKWNELQDALNRK